MDSRTQTGTEKNDVTRDNSTVSVVVEQLSLAPAPVPEFPEGGFRGWCTVIGAWLIQFTTFGYVNAFGAYQDFYVREYLNQSTPSEIGWIGGVQICLTFSMGIFTGRLFDMGYFYWLNATSLLFYAISLFMLSISKQNQYYQVLLAHGIALGLASGLSYIPSLSIVGHYFRRRRPLAIGIVSAGSALGATIHPLMLNHLFSGKIGFHQGVRISGALNVFLLIVANCLMRTRLPPHRAGPLFPLKRFLSDVSYVFALIGSLCAFLGLFFTMFYLQLYAVTHGIDENLAFYSLSILNAASIFGRMFPGFITHKLGSLNLAVLFMSGTGVVTACMSVVTGATGLIIYAACYGFISGGAIALTAAMMVPLIDDPKEYGARLGIFFFSGSLLGLVATPISGALLTSNYHWIPATLFAGIFVFFAGVWFLVARNLVARRRGTQIL